MNRPPIVADSGAPEGSEDYTTVVLFTGIRGPAPEACRNMLPLAKASNARLILANRRDYAATIRFSAQERADLFSAAAVVKTEPDVAQMKVLAWMRDRAREVYDLLVDIVRENKIPLAHPKANTGGIVVAGWSFGTSLMTAFLANMASFPAGDVDLRKYLRRVVFLDPPDFVLGFPQLAPMPEPDELPQGKDQLSDLPLFFSGYFQHGDLDDPDTYETRAPLAEPGPTWLKLTPEDIASFLDLVPGDLRGGMDNTLMTAGIATGAFAALRDAAVRLSEPEDDAVCGSGSGSGWDAVEARHVWGDRSMAAMVFAMNCMRVELEKERKAGARVRNVTFARVEGANHIMPWDLPERTLEAILRAS
uniref:Atypical/PIKK/TRRAP protein kinase n=1 Tax=Ganoderma boninense TaxID=34458 RepID=A0A5K1K6G4_9APHY|nr:Atypical/PIKK/TRRAP protein kinase [Ganoderma boninense]